MSICPIRIFPYLKGMNLCNTTTIGAELKEPGKNALQNFIGQLGHLFALLHILSCFYFISSFFNFLIELISYLVFKAVKHLNNNKDDLPEIHHTDQFGSSLVNFKQIRPLDLHRVGGEKSNQGRKVSNKVKGVKLNFVKVNARERDLGGRIYLSK